MFAIVQVVETFLNIRIRFQSYSKNDICDRQLDCCNLSPIPMFFYCVNWI